MHFLTPKECAGWCARHSVPLSSAQLPGEPAAVGMPTVRFGVPSSALGLVAFSSTLGGWFDDDSERLLWITGQHHGLQLFDLYRRLRRSHGDDANIRDCPGHLFGGSELEHLDSFLILALLTGVEGCLISSSGEQLFISGSGWL